MPIVGTAGHVDHGKSSLVFALTGHNPDRLIEEQQRGMTLDLGFAPLRFADGVEAGIIDVPGHERFLHNMLAGAAGMELVLLVIAANEGPKPQTFEHLQILNFLNAQRALIVLTKIDLVTKGERAMAAERAREACRGTLAQAAPVIGVSTLTSEGLPELRSAIHDAIASLPPRRTDAPAYMPVDRVFALPGHGTVITGTLMQGTIRSGDTLALQPSGLAARIKSMQTFGAKVEVAHAGSRVAVNLPGIQVRQVQRGETLVAARQFETQREFSVSFTPLASAFKMLRRRTPIRAHIGSDEIPGSLHFSAQPPAEIHPIQARLTLTRPTVVYTGMHVILRRMSPKDLLGGAIVQRTVPAAVPRTEAVSAALLATEESPLSHPQEQADAGAPNGATTILAVLHASDLRPLSAEKIAMQTNMLVASTRDVLAWLLENGEVIMLQKPAEYLSAQASENAWQRTLAWLAELHRSSPWKAGAATPQITKALAIPEPLGLRLLNAWHEDGRIANRSGRWHLPDFTPALSASQRAFFEKALAIDPANALLPHSYERLLQAAAGAADLAEALESLLSVRALVRLGDDVYRRTQIDRAKNVINAAIAQKGAATMAQLRDALGTSRKYALPLMEYFDSAGFTVRDGDLRRLRRQ